MGWTIPYPTEFRGVLIAVAAIGVLLGMSFGLGVACGHGNPKVAAGGLTTQQLQALGITQGGGTGAGTGAGAGTGSGTASNLATGQITSVDGQTVTVQTAQGAVKLNLSSTATATLASPAQASDLKPGMTVIATGTRRDDGSLNTSSITQVAAGLPAALGGGNRFGGASPTAGASPEVTAGGTPGARRGGTAPAQ